MRPIEKEFLNLFLDDGACTILAQASQKVRDILLKKPLNQNQIQRLGHCGIAAEYLSGIGMAHQDFAFYRQHPEKQDISEMIGSLVKCFKTPSQLSESPQDIAEKHYKNENCVDAIPRAITDVQIWSATSNLTKREKEILSGHLKQAKDSYKIIRSFAEKCCAMAPS